MRIKELFKILSFKRSVFFRLFMLHILILLLALGTILSIWINNITKTAETLSSSNITDVFSIVNSSFTYKMDTLNAYMGIIALNEATQDYLDNPNTETSRQLRTYLDTIYAMLHDDIQGIAVITDSSLSFGGYAYFSPNYKDYSWYSELLNSDGSCTLFSRSGTLSIGMALKKRNETVGVLVCELNKHFLNSIFGISTVDGALRTVILDENADVIYSTNRISEGEYLDDIIAVSQYQTHNNILQTVSLNDKNYKMISQSLNSTPEGWVNITYLPLEYVYSNYNASLKLALTCAAVIILVSVVFSYIIIVVWKNRLHNLYHYIENIDMNNLPTIESLPSNPKADEIENIYTKVNQMVNIMSSQVNSISQLAEKKHQYELQILKDQINPHLIYNTLNTIQMLAKMQKNTRIDNIVGSLSRLLLYSTVSLENPVPLSSELEHVQAYVDIMQNKFFNDIELVLTIEDGLEHCQVMKVILQPIVDNSIKHGFTDVPGNCIIIKAYRDDDNVIIKIIDNGNGIPQTRIERLLTDVPENDTHLGLKNINRRIKLCYGEQYGLQIVSIPQVQTSVLITIPYISEQSHSRRTFDSACPYRNCNKQ